MANMASMVTYDWSGRSVKLVLGRRLFPNAPSLLLARHMMGLVSSFGWATHFFLVKQGREERRGMSSWSLVEWLSTMFPSNRRVVDCLVLCLPGQRDRDSQDDSTHGSESVSGSIHRCVCNVLFLFCKKVRSATPPVRPLVPLLQRVPQR